MRRVKLTEAEHAIILASRRDAALFNEGIDAARTRFSALATDNAGCHGMTFEQIGQELMLLRKEIGGSRFDSAATEPFPFGGAVLPSLSAARSFASALPLAQRFSPSATAIGFGITISARFGSSS